MTSFKEFLEKESGWINSWEVSDQEDVHPSHSMRIISVRKLGEWALNASKSLEVEPKSHGIIAKAMLMEIAVACGAKK